jgi:hypothetical protein
MMMMTDVFRAHGVVDVEVVHPESRVVGEEGSHHFGIVELEGLPIRAQNRTDTHCDSV